MKRILITLCVAATVMSAFIPTLAVEAGRAPAITPLMWEEYMEGNSHRIKKTYQLSLADDPAAIPTEDFVLDGRLYYQLDMTRKDKIGVDVQTYTETVTQASDTNKLETILQ